MQRETLKLQLARIADARQIVNHQLVTTLHLPVGTDICPDTTLLDKEVQTLAEEDWQKLATRTHLGLRQSVALLLLLLLYDAPVRRSLKLMPLWTRVRREAEG